MDPIPLPEAGELVVPDERTEENLFQRGEVIGRHKWEGCSGGEVSFNGGTDGGFVACTGCRLHLDLPKGVGNYPTLREHLAAITALRGGGKPIRPIPLPDGGVLLIPKMSGLTEESRLLLDGMIGSHHGSPSCNGGVVSFYPLAQGAGWVLTCNKCLFRLEVSEKPEGGGEWTYAALRKVAIQACVDAAKGGAK